MANNLECIAFINDALSALSVAKSSNTC